jgi:hypothetical protein
MEYKSTSRMDVNGLGYELEPDISVIRERNVETQTFDKPEYVVHTGRATWGSVSCNMGDKFIDPKTSYLRFDVNLTNNPVSPSYLRKPTWHFWESALNFIRAYRVRDRSGNLLEEVEDANIINGLLNKGQSSFTHTSANGSIMYPRQDPPLDQDVVMAETVKTEYQIPLQALLGFTRTSNYLPSYLMKGLRIEFLFELGQRVARWNEPPLGTELSGTRTAVNSGGLHLYSGDSTSLGDPNPLILLTGFQGEIAISQDATTWAQVFPSVPVTTGNINVTKFLPQASLWVWGGENTSGQMFYADHSDLFPIVTTTLLGPPGSTASPRIIQELASGKLLVIVKGPIGTEIVYTTNDITVTPPTSVGYVAGLSTNYTFWDYDPIADIFMATSTTSGAVLKITNNGTLITEVDWSGAFPGGRTTGIAFNPILARWIVLRNGQTSNAYSDDGGVSWNPQPIVIPPPLTAIINGDNGFIWSESANLFIAGQQSGGSLFSYDGLFWTSIETAGGPLYPNLGRVKGVSTDFGIVYPDGNLPARPDPNIYVEFFEPSAISEQDYVYTVSDPQLILDTLTLTDAAEKAILTRVTGGGPGLDLAFRTWSLAGGPASSKQLHLETRKACSRAFGAVWHAQVDELKFENELLRSSMVTQVPFQVSRYQWTVGSSHYPVEPLRAGSAAQLKREAFLHTLRFLTSEMQSSTDNGRFALDDYDNIPFATDFPSPRTGAAAICALTLARSPSLTNSGIPLNNSMPLEFDAVLQDTTRRVHRLYLQYLKVLKIYANNIEVEE